MRTRGSEDGIEIERKRERKREREREREEVLEVVIKMECQCYLWQSKQPILKTRTIKA